MTEARTRRKYTKRQKVTAVIAAEMASVEQAAAQSGIPRSTLRYWMNDPELAEYRQKTRDEQAEAASTLGMIVLAEIKKRLPEFDPEDLPILYGILMDKAQLLSGQATSRTETRDLTDILPTNDHERVILRDLIDEELKRRAEVPA